MTQGKKTALVTGALLAFIAIMLVFFSDKGPSPVVETQNRIRALETPVLEFAGKNGALPETLEDLNLPIEATTDHAGTPLVYELDGKTVTISSLGADGKTGGAAFNADKTHSFEWQAP